MWTRLRLPAQRGCILSGREKKKVDSESSFKNSMSWPSEVFVGREREMGILGSAFEKTLSGERTVAMLVGEPGIGKTRTARQFARFAERQGAIVLWGRCPEGSEAPAMRPWIQIIRSYADHTDPEVLAQELGSGASAIAEVVVSLKEKLPELEPLREIQDPKSSRFRLFDSVGSFFQLACLDRPVVMVMDNLHWWDEPSLKLLEFIAYEIRDAQLMIIGTYRDSAADRSHPLRQVLVNLTREQLFQRVALRALSREDVTRFIEQVYQENPDGALVDALFARSEGNPLFMTEVVKLLMADGQESGGDDRGATLSARKIPEGVREVIGSRLDRLSGGCRGMLSLCCTAVPR